MRSEYLKRTPKPQINKLIVIIIENALKDVKIPELRRVSKLSLVNFYLRQYAEISRLTPQMLEVVAVLKALTSGEITTQNKRVLGLRADGIYIEGGKVIVPKANLYGVPMREFAGRYMDKNVRPVLDRLSEQQALDPDDIRGRNSLRNRAEMEVRYNDHLRQIDNLKSAGHTLVIASTHADCSERCRPWQGRVYSLDGTSGTTSDGRKFIPLEKATDVIYTTKAGKTYKNGLLGFNCRHYLVPYTKGFQFPPPNVKEERKQYAITLKQRALERNVRRWRTEALTSKGIDDKRYIEARKKAEAWNNAYIKFSKDNGRAYYPSRTKII